MPFIASGQLYSLNLKINCQDFGFNEKWWVTGAAVEDARAKAEVIATARRRLLTQDAEIFFATLSRIDSKRDSKFVPSAVGQGLFINSGVDPAPTFANDPFIGAKLRIEHEDGSSVTRIINPLNDPLVERFRLLDSQVPDSVLVRFTGATPVAGDLSSYKLQLENFMKVISRDTVHINGKINNDGNYEYFDQSAVFYLGLAKKKGGAAFI